MFGAMKKKFFFERERQFSLVFSNYDHLITPESNAVSTLEVWGSVCWGSVVTVKKKNGIVTESVIS